MTFNRCLLVMAILIGSTLGVLAFGNPQWRWCYVFQAYHFNDIAPYAYRQESGKITWSIKVLNSEDPSYSGRWHIWDSDGELKIIQDFKNGVKEGEFSIVRDSARLVSIGGTLNKKFVKIYYPIEKIDRRTEFGISIK